MSAWRWPSVLAAVTMFALLSALLGGHGVWVWLSWAALSVPLIVIAAAVWRSRARPQ